MIRHGAKLAFAYAEATVPRVCVVLRKAYGGAFIVMDCKSMGNDCALAWPTAEIAVMGAKGAVEILGRRELDGGARRPEREARRRQLEADYEAEHLSPAAALERGYVDEVIDPADTRRAVAGALAARRQARAAAPRRHDNIPLCDPRTRRCCSTARSCWSPACSPRTRSPPRSPAWPRSRAPSWCSPRSAAACA